MHSAKMPGELEHKVVNLVDNASGNGLQICGKECDRLKVHFAIWKAKANADVVQQYLVVTDTQGALVDTRDPAVSESITRALANVSLMAQLKRMARADKLFQNASAERKQEMKARVEAGRLWRGKLGLLQSEGIDKAALEKVVAVVGIEAGPTSAKISGGGGMRNELLTGEMPAAFSPRVMGIKCTSALTPTLDGYVKTPFDVTLPVVLADGSVESQTVPCRLVKGTPKAFLDWALVQAGLHAKVYPGMLSAVNKTAQEEGRTLLLSEPTKGFNQAQDVIEVAKALLVRMPDLDEVPLSEADEKAGVKKVLTNVRFVRIALMHYFDVRSARIGAGKRKGKAVNCGFINMRSAEAVSDTNSEILWWVGAGFTAHDSGRRRTCLRTRSVARPGAPCASRTRRLPSSKIATRWTPVRARRECRRCVKRWRRCVPAKPVRKLARCAMRTTLLHRGAPLG